MQQFIGQKLLASIWNMEEGGRPQLQFRMEPFTHFSQHIIWAVFASLWTTPKVGGAL